MRVRLATVGFHTRALKRRDEPSLPTCMMSFSCEVISSMAAMKTSAASATPRKVQSNKSR